MKRCLAAILGGLILSVMATGAAFASDEASHPAASAPVLSSAQLQACLHPGTEKAAGATGYTLNKTLVTDSADSVGAGGDSAPVELGLEQELPAVRFKTDTGLTPYLGAGIAIGGDADDSLDLGPDSGSAEEAEADTTYRVAAGFDLPVSKTTRVDLGYRYSTSASTDFTRIDGTDSGARVDDHHISFGLEMAY